MVLTATGWTAEAVQLQSPERWVLRLVMIQLQTLQAE